MSGAAEMRMEDAKILPSPPNVNGNILFVRSRDEPERLSDGTTRSTLTPQGEAPLLGTQRPPFDFHARRTPGGVPSKPQSATHKVLSSSGATTGVRGGVIRVGRRATGYSRWWSSGFG